MIHHSSIYNCLNCTIVKVVISTISLSSYHMSHVILQFYFSQQPNIYNIRNFRLCKFVSFKVQLDYDNAVMVRVTIIYKINYNITVDVKDKKINLKTPLYTTE